MMMTPADVLDRGADLIDERGWLQGDYTNEAGALCVMGALRAAVGGEVKPGQDIGDRAYFQILPATNALSMFTPFMFPGSIPQWNDCPGRSQGEVTSAMRTAAALWRAQNQEKAAPVMPVAPEEVAA